jgi:predicted AAA+ superfamily ATPase
VSTELDASARRAMLTRLAGDINVLAHADQVTWTCCDLKFTHEGNAWSWTFCGGSEPGRVAWQFCPHWHHEHTPLPVVLG